MIDLVTQRQRQGKKHIALWKHYKEELMDASKEQLLRNKVKSSQ